MEIQIDRDLRAAFEICSDFPRLKCLEATEEMVKEFGDEIKVLYVCTEAKALCPFIVLSEQRDDVITETHNHYAVFLHDLVFDNVFPNGLPLDDWLSSYMYISKDDVPTLFTREDIQWMNVEQFKNRNGHEEIE